MDSNSEAIKPDYFHSINRLKELDEAEVEEAVSLREEQMLHALSTHEGWNVLKNFIKSQVDGLDEINKEQMLKGADFMELGRNAVVSQICKEVLTKVINKVEDAAEAIES